MTDPTKAPDELEALLKYAAERAHFLGDRPTEMILCAIVASRMIGTTEDLMKLVHAQVQRDLQTCRAIQREG